MTFVTPDIKGFLDPNEAALLYRLASEVPAGGVIVEIGSYQGKSTVCLGRGAKVNGARVYAIDPHEDFQESENTHYGAENYAALLKNLIEFNVADVVRVVALASEEIARSWWRTIDLLFIDGEHSEENVRFDFNEIGKFADLIAMHDTTGNHPGVTQALNEILAAGEWEIIERADATAVLRRVNVRNP